jgi:hypothetical protein
MPLPVSQQAKQIGDGEQVFDDRVGAAGQTAMLRHEINVDWKTKLRLLRINAVFPEFHAPVAQLVEHETCNFEVAGSIPCRGLQVLR